MTVRLDRIALALVLGALAACATAPRPGYPGRPGQTPGTQGYPDLSAYPRSAEAISGPAVLKLMDQARADLAAGNSEKAVADLELALDIEPRNPFVWSQLADTHLARHLPDQAEDVAQRANSFAHGNPYIEIENWRVIEQARQARGDAPGVQEARARIAELQSQLSD